MEIPIDEQREKVVCSDGTVEANALSEAFLKEVLDSLDWDRLRVSLGQIGLDENALAFLLGHLRRSNK